MFRKFTSREMVFLALLAAANFVVSFIFGGAIVAATGIPLASGFFTGLTIGITAILAIRTVPKFGSLTLVFTIYSILELPTALGGAPGFWPKIPINAISALLGDIWLHFTKYRTWSVYPAFYVILTANLLLFAYFLWLLGLPGVEKLLAILYILLPVYWVIGTGGILIGFWLYGRLKNKRMFRMMQG